MDPLRLYLLGSPHLERNGQVVEMDTRKALALLAVLSISGHEQQRDSLATLLYPESDTSSARAALRRTLSTLHAGLGEGVLSIRREAVGLAAQAPLWVDVTRFRELSQHLEDRNSLTEAASLYQGDFMAGFSLRDSPAFDDWQYQQSDELRRLLDRVLGQLALLLADQGNIFGAIEAAERRVGLDPLVEESHRQLMELLVRANQPGAALRQYRECARILEHELGVKPLQATTHLYEQILNGQPVDIRLPAKRGASLSPISTHLAEQPGIPLIGREQEMEALAQALAGAADSGLLIAVEGETGVGKTRFVEEFLLTERQAGRQIAQARCYDGQSGLAYTPFMEALSGLLNDDPNAARRLAHLPPGTLLEATRLIPGLPASADQASSMILSDGPGAQTRFFESLRVLLGSLLKGENPGILFIDDLQWADTGTLDLLAYLGRRIRATGCFIIVAWRSDYGTQIEHLSQLMRDLQRTGDAYPLHLGRLSLEDIRQLASSLDAGLPARLIDRLYLESEGLPFIAIEYLRSLKAVDAGWKLPGGVMNLLHQRLLAPGEAARQLLAAAAVIGRSFDFMTLQAVSGRSEWETIAGLEELVGLGLIREHGPQHYDFNHDKLRAVAYEEASATRRSLLHRRAAEFIVASGQAEREAGAWAGLAANHFLRAGLVDQAAEYFWQAGWYARRLYANADALAAFQAALAAGHPDLAGLHEACGDLQVLRGEYREAIDNYQSAAAICKIDCLSNVLHKLGEIDHRLGEWQAAKDHYRAALDAAGEESDPAWRAHLFADWSLTTFNAAELDPARQLAQKALEWAQQSADASALAQANNMLGILARADGELGQAETFFKRSLDILTGNEDLSLRIAALHNLARLEQERSHYSQAIPLAREALEYCTRIGDRHHQAALLNTLADLQHAVGNEAEAMTYLKQAVSLFAEIGRDTGLEIPEIWKLTEW